MSKEEIETKLKDFPAWKFDEELNKLVSGFEFENYQQCVDFVNGVADFAEDFRHHPDVFIHDQRFVSLFVSTGESDSITDADFAFIKALEEELVDAK